MPSTDPQSIRRVFLGWDQPVLPRVVQHLVAEFGAGRQLDLRKVIVVVPGKRAGRRLLEILVMEAEAQRLVLTPPDIVTEGELPERLYVPKRPFASDIVQRLAWAKALRMVDGLAHVVPHPPPADDHLRWIQLGESLGRLHRELAADNLEFEDVPRRAEALRAFTEHQRWKTMCAIRAAYHGTLNALGLWDIQTARMRALSNGEIHTDCRIVLVSTVDLNETVRRMLLPIADRVTALVVAPEERAGAFDTHGCLIAERWCDAAIPIADGQILSAEGPVDQADVVSGWLAEVADRYCCDEVVIGAPDETLVPQLQRQLQQAGVAARWMEGARIGETLPFQLLSTALQFAHAKRYEDFAALIRHPDLEQWLIDRLEPPISLIAQLDAYYAAHLPRRVESRLIPPNSDEWPTLVRAVERVEQWLASAAERRSLGAWADSFRTILGEIYSARQLEPDNPRDEALYRTLDRILVSTRRLSDLPAELDTAALSAVEAFHIAAGSLADEPLPVRILSNAIEILGWLELPLDDAPALVVTSINEEFVPQSAGADPFLPDTLRRELSIMHNGRRYARDAYAATVLCQTRRELRWIAARRDAKGDPLRPSRLLFACDDQTLIRRAERFFGKREAMPPRRRQFLIDGPPPLESRFSIPRPRPLLWPMNRIRVTDFKIYLACPFRFYLQRVEKIQTIDDSSRELDSGSFGSLLHLVLGRFGQMRELRSRPCCEDISAFLSAELAQIAKDRYRDDFSRPAIRMQLEQARQRLRAFAREQATLAAEGWQLIYAEDELCSGLATPFVVDDIPILLTGQIDRIDWHPAERVLRILDYKTSDKELKPEKTHREADVWIDLQLPLYRHLAAGMNLPKFDKLELGYFNLPRDIRATGVRTAEWDSAALDSADHTARDVVRRIRNPDPMKAFWPPANAPKYSEDLAAICLDNVLRAPALGEEENES